MGQSVRDSPGGHSNIKERNCAFQPVVAGFMEKIAQSDVCGIFSDKIHRQRRGISVENTDDGIQFASAALQILMSNSEICRTQRDGGSKQGDVRLVPELMLIRRHCRGGSLPDDRAGHFKRRLRRIYHQCLAEKGRTTDATGNDCSGDNARQSLEIAGTHRGTHRFSARLLVRRNPSTTYRSLRIAAICWESVA
jgi:hypothetical protein